MMENRYLIDLISFFLENVKYEIIIIYSPFKVTMLNMNKSYVKKTHKDDSHFTMGIILLIIHISFHIQFKLFVLKLMHTYNVFFNIYQFSLFLSLFLSQNCNFVMQQSNWTLIFY